MAGQEGIGGGGRGASNGYIFILLGLFYRYLRASALIINLSISQARLSGALNLASAKESIDYPL